MHKVFKKGVQYPLNRFSKECFNLILHFDKVGWPNLYIKSKSGQLGWEPLPKMLNIFRICRKSNFYFTCKTTFLVQNGLKSTSSVVKHVQYRFISGNSATSVLRQSVFDLPGFPLKLVLIAKAIFPEQVAWTSDFSVFNLQQNNLETFFLYIAQFETFCSQKIKKQDQVSDYTGVIIVKRIPVSFKPVDWVESALLTIEQERFYNAVVLVHLGNKTFLFVCLFVCLFVNYICLFVCLLLLLCFKSTITFVTYFVSSSKFEPYFNARVKGYLEPTNLKSSPLFTFATKSLGQDSSPVHLFSITIESSFTAAKIKLGEDSPGWFVFPRSRFTFK